MKTLCIEGWRGVNHSIAMVNQNQILEMVKDSRFQLFHRDAPFFMPHWDRSKLDSGFSPEERAIIDGLADPGEQVMDTCLRIASPVRLGRPELARRHLTFVVTEFGLSGKSFDPPDLPPSALTQGDDQVITPTRWSKARLVEYGFDPDKVQVVPHGYKTDTFFPMTDEQRQQARQALNIRPDEIVFTNVGVATWNKGIDLLLLAFAELRLSGLPVRLILKDHQGLYGISVERVFAEMAARAPQLGLPVVRDGIAVLSTSLNLPQIRSLYALSDAYVSPYRAEGFNLPVLEAMGCGTHVIVSGGGATDDFTPPELCHRLFTRPGTPADAPQPVGGAFVVPDLEDLREAMLQVVEKRLPPPARREAARQRLAQRFSWGPVTRQLLDLC
ncbi:glycosyltransferase family 4 protein [Roseateles sp. SL47]|uniref:glycosyltransferase family 4 protein n=1 Tax=Roseateles sp. SL47 TaxID=2995138 RepID=UPI00226E1B74|nr:glycosyltransferase family 4 protein [Roseateles sp. SL47]WAC71911.1 glycosyltransferase family 4 protein [Roseateles sp. SL47]